MNFNMTRNSTFQYEMTMKESNMEATTTSYLVNRIPFVETDVIFFAVFIFIFMVFGIAVNLLTIIVIVTSAKLRSIFHYFIFSLCISDLMSALVSWVNLYRRTWGFNYFALSEFICVLYRVVDIWTSYSTALHILSFAILRLISLRWPLKMTRIRNGYPLGVIWILAIWLLTFICGGIPFILMHGARTKNRASGEPYAKWPACTVLPEWFTIYKSYTTYTFPIFFYIPIVFTLVLSAAIIVLLIKRTRQMKSSFSDSSMNKRKTKERNAVLQLLLIVTSFIIGYVPFTAFEFHTSAKSNDTYETWWIDWHFGTAQYMFLRLSECLNPIFYNLGSKTMWGETKKFLFNKCNCFLPKTATRAATSGTGSTVLGDVVRS